MRALTFISILFLLFPALLWGQKKFQTSFEKQSVGTAYTFPVWEADGFVTGNVDNGLAVRTMVDNTVAATGKQSLRITYPEGLSGPGGNGAQVSLVLPEQDQYYLSYKLKFSDHFSYRLGGKLPGLAAGKLCSGGQVCDGTNGFTARFMWRPDGKVILYLYHMNRTGQWGDDCPLIYPSGEQVTFERGKWYQLAERVKINSSGEKSDGEVEVWVDGVPVLLRKGLRFTSNGEKVNRFYFSTFHGGSGPDWAPLETSYIWFDDLILSPRKKNVLKKRNYFSGNIQAHEKNNPKQKSDFDEFGGWKRVKGMKTGFFHTQQLENRWWLVSPEGNAFFCKGVGGVGWWQEAPASDDPSPWPQKTVGMLKDLNFNAVGLPNPAMYGQKMPYATMLDLASCQDNLWETGKVLDYFSKDFIEKAERQAAANIPRFVNDPWLIGYFTDNELHWSFDWRSKANILEAYLKMPESSPGHQKAIEFLKEKKLNPAHGIPNVVHNEFLEMVADQYARVCRDAIRRYDKNHLILGCRFYGYLWGWCESCFEPESLLRGVAPYFDVITCNNYSSSAPVELFRKITEITGKPLMVTEFSFRAADSGMPNTRGAGYIVATEEERAERYAKYVEDLAALPGCVGFHWFMYRDQPKDSPGENSNYGIVRYDFSPYETMTCTMKQVNAQLESKVLAAGKK